MRPAEYDHGGSGVGRREREAASMLSSAQPATVAHEALQRRAPRRRASGIRLAWQLEWKRALRRHRLFVLNVIVPLSLVLPVAIGRAPPQHAAVVYAVLFVFFGTFGSGIPLLRDAERGMVRRLVLLPLHGGQFLVGRALASAAIDLVQLAPACLLVAATGPFTRFPIWMFPILAGVLIVGAVLGTWIAAIARSVAEGALFAAVAALLLLHASGAFRTPLPGSLGAAIEKVAPFRALHELLLGASFAGGIALLAWLVCALLLTLVAGPRLLRSLARADGQR